MYEYAATCERVVDGDTAHLSIDLGLSVHVHETCRLYGINAPEMHGATKDAGKAAYVELCHHLFDEAGQPRPLVVETLKDAKCKYGRYLVVIRRAGEALGESMNVNEAMVTAGHAVEYGEGM